MIDSYNGNLLYHGGNFVGGVEKRDYIEPNVVLRTDFGYFYPYQASASPVFSCTDVPTGASAIGTSATYSTAWHSWGAPTVNDCYVYSAAWSGEIYHNYIQKNTLTAKQDINKVWKGTDRPIPTYVVKRWFEPNYGDENYGFYPVNALEGLGLISICYDRSHSASEIKPSGYQLDCSHIKNYAVLKADLGPSSYACFNVLGKSTSGPNSGCYWIENLTALDCSALVGGPVGNSNERGLYPYVIKNALFSLASGIDYSFHKLGCKYAINVSGANEDINRNTLYAVYLSGCHNVLLDSMYVTTSTGYRFINNGWWKCSNSDTHEDWEFREFIDYNRDLCDTDGTPLQRCIIDSDVKISRTLTGTSLPYIERSNIDLSDGDYWRTSNSVFQDSTFSGMLVDMIYPTNSGLLPKTSFTSCTFKNVTWYQKNKAGINAIFNLPSAYTNNSGFLLGIWTSASL
jgi:hypothetical protein